MTVRNTDFFIAGAPKCGTTVLYTYLKRHPNVFFPALKEPGYFCDDMPGLQFIQTAEEYEELYSEVEDRHKRIGDATVTYLASENTAERIKHYNPDAQFIVMLRNPVDMIVSSHAQLLFTGNESQEKLADAWNLQSTRLAGEEIPHGCIEPLLLQYAHMASNGAHLQRLLRYFPREQILIITFDELSECAQAVYRRTLSFLGLPDDGQKDFRKLNESKVSRYKLLTRLIHDRRLPFHHGKKYFKRKLRGRAYEFVAKVYQATGKPSRPERISPELAAQIYDRLRTDIELLETLLERRLTSWHPVAHE